MVIRRNSVTSNVGVQIHSFGSCLPNSFTLFLIDNVTIPPRPDITSTSLNHFKSWPGNHRVVPIWVSHISSWLQELQSREWEKRTQNKRTIGAWVSSKCKKRSYVTLYSMCICRLSLTRSFCTSHEECWLILTGLPSQILDPISCRLVSAAVLCRLPTANLHLPSPTASSGFFLPNPLAFPCLPPVASRSRAQAFLCFSGPPT